MTETTTVQLVQKEYKPLFDKVLVKLIDMADRTQAGILLPNNNEKVQEATVVAVGTGLLLEGGDFLELPVQEGDTVLVPRGAGTIVKLNGVEHWLLRVQEICAIVEEVE